MVDYCVECKENTVAVAKYGLCMKCYQRARRKGVKSSAIIADCKPVEIKNRQNREMSFVKNFFNHNNWIHQPGIFRIDMFSYSPDFYDGNRNAYIEVAGTRQAYHANKSKIKQIKKAFPLINFEIRQVSGKEISIDSDDRIEWDGEESENKS